MVFVSPHTPTSDAEKRQVFVYELMKSRITNHRISLPLVWLFFDGTPIDIRCARRAIDIRAALFYLWTQAL